MSNRRGFLKNIGAAITGTVVASSIIATETVSASVPVPVSLEPKVPTFEECYQKVLLKNETLTNLEVIIYSSEMNRLAWASDIPIISKLRETCSNEQEFIDALDLHRRSRASILHYWAVLPYQQPDGKYRNLVNVHKYVISSILTVSLKYSNYKKA